MLKSQCSLLCNYPNRLSICLSICLPVCRVFNFLTFLIISSKNLPKCYFANVPQSKSVRHANFRLKRSEIRVRLCSAVNSEVDGRLHITSALGRRLMLL